MQDKIRQATIKDLNAVNFIMKHPEVYPYTKYDGKIPVEEFSAKHLIECGPPVYTLIDSDNCFVAVLVPENSIMWIAHDNVLPEARGKKAVRICRSMIQWMFENTPCEKIIGYTPITNRPAWVFAQMCGMHLEGRISKGVKINGILHDVYISGIGKGE